VETSGGNVVKMRSASGKPPALPPPPVATQPGPAPQPTPPQRNPSAGQQQ
jgi:hypothetical protein